MHMKLENENTLASHDSSIREPLFDYLDELYGRIRILEEIDLGRARADVIMVTPQEICGIEIKSDNDTYTRLANQVKTYDKYFDRNTVVVGSKHATHVKDHVPDYWGILSGEEIDGVLDFYEVRPASPNPKVKERWKYSLLWKTELSHIREKYGLPKYRGKSKDFVLKKMIEKLPPEIFQRHACEELMERDYSVFLGE